MEGTAGRPITALLEEGRRPELPAKVCCSRVLASSPGSLIFSFQRTREKGGEPGTQSQVSYAPHRTV